MQRYKVPTFYKKDTDISTEMGQAISFPIHIHSYYEMVLYEQFDGYVGINDRIVIPDSNTAILFIPGDFHEIVVNDNSEKNYRKISFPTTVFEKTNMPKWSMVLKSIDSDSLFFRTCNEIMNNPHNEQLKKILTQVLICIITQNGEKIIASESVDSNWYSSEAVRIINEKYDNNLTLSLIAKRLSITPQYLSNTFKSNLGITFSGYLTAIRLQHAEKLLIETDKSITDICNMCGYKNFSHFIRSFKKTYGISPSSYRKNRTP